jgi:hypothetical protein
MGSQSAVNSIPLFGSSNAVDALVADIYPVKDRIVPEIQIAKIIRYGYAGAGTADGCHIFYRYQIDIIFDTTGSG